MEGKRKKSRKHHAKKLHGFEGKRRRHHSRPSKHHLHGADGFNPAALAVDIAGLLAGAIGVSFISSMIPIKDAKLKTLVPLGIGLLGLSMPKLSKNHFINRVALGSLAIGGYSLTKQLVPSLPLMGAGDTAEGIGHAIENLPPEEKAILGILPAQLEYNGEPEYHQTMGSGPGEMLGSVEMIEGAAGDMLGEVEFNGTGDFE